MAGTPTTNYSLPTMAGSDLISTIDEWTVSAMGAVDSKMVGYTEGVEGSRPSAGVKGRTYRATDTGRWFFDTGSSWVQVMASTAPATSYAEVLTAESTASLTPADLATVGPSATVTAPTHGLLSVFASVDINQPSSVNNAGVSLSLDGTDQGGVVSSTRQGIMRVPTNAGYATIYTSSATPLGVDATLPARVQASALIIPVASGSHTVKLTYFVTNQGSGFFRNRKLWARVLAF